MQTKKITSTILSMSLLTVMAGAAIAPALGTIREYFASEPKVLVQLIVSMPALFIILTNMLFLEISRHAGSRAIALTGLVLYVVAGSACYFAHDIYVLLLLRALLGVSVGLVMPLSTGLLAYYYPPEEQARLMGLSAAMNQLGGVVATLLAGLLCTIKWNNAFLVYLIGLIAIIMVIMWLPDARLGSSNKRGVPFAPRQLLKFHPSVIGMLLVMSIFFVFVTNFAMSTARLGWSPIAITLVMVGVDVVGFLVGLLFGQLMRRIPREMKYMAPLFFGLGFLLFAISHASLSILLGAACIGIANGVGVPYLNTIASIKGGQNSATTVMPLLSSALYLGQFISPLIVSPLAQSLSAGRSADAATAMPYWIAVGISLIFVIQTYTTRHYQSLPPNSGR